MSSSDFIWVIILQSILALMEKFVNVEDPMHHSFLQKGQELKKELENLLGEFPIILLNTKHKFHNLLTRLITQIA